MSVTDEVRVTNLARQPMRAAGPTPGFFRGTVTSITEVWAYRQLLVLLVKRELKARYKDSTLGFFWSLMRPLAQLLIYYVALGKFLGAQRSIPEYAIFVYTGLTIWQLLSEILSAGTASIVNNGGLVKKVYLPREVFPLSAIGSAVFNFVIQLVVLIVAAVLVGSPPGGLDLLYAPLSLAVVLLWGTALAFLLSAVNVYLRDIQYLIEIVLMIAFWTAPVVYSWRQVQHELGNGILLGIYDSNPLTNVVLGFQRAFWVKGRDNPVPEHITRNLIILVGVGLVLVWICQRVFARLQSNFAQEL